MGLDRVMIAPVTSLCWVIDQYRRPNDYLLATMQSSGTHWVRMILAKAIVDYYGINYEFNTIRPKDLIPGFGADVRRQLIYNSQWCIPRVLTTHQFFRFPRSILFRQKRTILLIRDLRDALVSHYRKRVRGGSTMDFEQFLKDPNDELQGHSIHGSLAGRVSFLNSWSQLVGSPDLLIVKYENLKYTPKETLAEMLNYMGMRDISDRFLTEVLDFASLENMKRIATQADMTDNSSSTTTEANAVDEGKTGSWDDLFDKRLRLYFVDTLPSILDMILDMITLTSDSDAQCRKQIYGR